MLKRTTLFAQRNAKEILRDPINLFFGLGFPLILLLLLSVINAAIPAEAANTMFSIENLTPGLAMFGTVFMALFAGMLLAKDRSSSFLLRLFASPLRAVEFILGYTLPMLAITLVQALLTLLVSGFAGLAITLYLLPAALVSTLCALLYVGIGLFCGSAMNDKAVGGICGALLTNVAGWLSGVFVPIDLIGGVFKTISDILPFYHGVQAIRLTLEANFAAALPHLGIVLAYTLVIFALAVVLFRRKMRGGQV